MAAKKRPTAKRIVDSPQVRQGTADGNGRSGLGPTAQRNGRAPAQGQRPGGKGAGNQPLTGKQAAKARSRTAAVQTPQRRFFTPLVGWIGGGVVLVVVAILIIVSVTSSTPSNNGNGRVALPAGLIKQVTSVPTASLDAVGIGNQPASKTSSAANPVAPVPPDKQASATVPPVSTGGGHKLPVFFYYGGEFCPYCATERWSMIVALSRFGTFSGLRGMSSSASDFAPSTQTFTFYQSSYTSKYLAFQPVETEDVNQQPLEQPTADQAKVLQAWDPKLSFPFISIGGKYIGGLPNWLDPMLLHGLSRADIAQDLSIAGNVAGTPLIANANYLTAAICNVTGGQPGSVCTSKGVMAAQAQFKNLAPATPVQ